MKKHLLKFFVSLTVVLLFVGFNSQSVFADTSSDGRWEYESDDNEGVKITEYIGSETEVDVPAELGGKPVTTIGEYAFDDCSNLQSVDMPSVETIGEFAFEDCSNLQSVDLSNVTTIGEAAFWGCSSLQGVDMPSVETIGKSAFKDCSNLQSVVMPSVTTIGESAFWKCSSLQGVDLSNVTTIGESAFSVCSSLTSITIPKSAASIGDCAFFGCSELTGIVVAADNTVYDSRDNCNAIIETASNKLIQGCKNTVIPNSVTSIGNNAFQLCSGLTGITIPSGVEKIGVMAFRASGLTSITIPGTVTSIGDDAFSDCSNLKSVTILSDSATTPTFGKGVFNYCSGELKIYCFEGSAAESYAQNEGISYELLVKATSISLNETSTAMHVGENKNLSVATVVPSSAYTNINWSSSDEAVAVVDNTGKITANGEGNATITATDEVSGCTATCTVTVDGTSPNPNPNPNPGPDPEPTPGHNHNWEWRTITEPTEYSDGMEGYICTICGATKDTVTITSTGVFMENKYNQVKNAKAGETVVLEMGPWHSLSKGFMEEIAKRRDVTFVIHFIYEGKKYEVVIPAGRPLVLDPSIDWYGPLKQNEMFGMKEIM